MRPARAALLLGAGACAAQAAPSPVYTAAEIRADQQFTTYAYAHEFGSGIYDFDGRTLQVYGLPLAWTSREATPEAPGVRWTLPVTVGFLDFRTTDVLHTGLPDRVDSISVVPGVELDFELGEHWHLRPYAQAGSSYADERDVETVIFGAGLRAQRDLALDDFDGTYSSEAIYSSVHYRGDYPDDDFVRWRNAVSFGRGIGLEFAGHALRAGGFWLVDAYVDPPTGPATGLDVPRLQIEAGAMLGTVAPWRVWGVALPQLGISYRFAGELSSFRFVIGAPF